MFFKKYGDIVVGVFFMLLSAVVMFMATQLPKSAVMDIGPDFMPMVIGAVTFLLAALLTFLNVKNFKMHMEEAEAAADSIEECNYKRVLSSFVLTVVYVMILQPVGFIISTIIYLPLQMLILAPEDKRKPLPLVILTVIFTLVVFFLFRYGFKIVLPAGIFTINL